MLDLSSLSFVVLNLKCSQTPNRLEAAILFTHDIKIRTESNRNLEFRIGESNRTKWIAVHRNFWCIAQHYSCSKRQIVFDVLVLTNQLPGFGVWLHHADNWLLIHVHIKHVFIVKQAIEHTRKWVFFILVISNCNAAAIISDITNVFINSIPCVQFILYIIYFFVLYCVKYTELKGRFIYVEI